MDGSPFGKLSAEMRNVVYSMVLSADKRFFLTTDRPYGKPLITGSCPTEDPLAITTVCRQIREETTQMFYHVNTFDIRYPFGVNSYDRDEFHLLHKFCASIGNTNASALRHVTLTFKRYQYDPAWVITEKRRHIKHQLMILLAFTARNTNCQLVVRIEWRHDTDEQNMGPPRIKFRLETGDEGFTKAIAKLERYRDIHGSRQDLFAVVKADKSRQLLYVLEEIVSEDEDSSDAASEG